MADNYLITGYWGVNHITPENDRGINAAMFGGGRFVLPIGQRFKAEYIGNNTVRIYDGMLMINGAAAGIPAGQYVDLLIPSAGQGERRKDLIVFQYTKDTSTLIEKGEFIVVSGGIDEFATLTEGNLLTGAATLDQTALYNVFVNGTEITLSSLQLGVRGAVRTDLKIPAATVVINEEVDWHIQSVFEEMSIGEVRYCEVEIIPEYVDNRFTVGRWLFQIYKATEDTGTVYGIGANNAQVCFMISGGYARGWENVNPQLLAGVEYRTTERFNGKPVYTKLLSQTWAAGGSITFSAPDIDTPFRFCGKVGTWVLPFLHSGTLTGSHTAVVTMHKNGDDIKIFMYGGDSVSGTLLLQYWYTKK